MASRIEDIGFLLCVFQQRMVASKHCAWKFKLIHGSLNVMNLHVRFSNIVTFCKYEVGK